MTKVSERRILSFRRGPEAWPAKTAQRGTLPLPESSR